MKIDAGDAHHHAPEPDLPSDWDMALAVANDIAPDNETAQTLHDIFLNRLPRDELVDLYCKREMKEHKEISADVFWRAANMQRDSRGCGHGLRHDGSFEYGTCLCLCLCSGEISVHHSREFWKDAHWDGRATIHHWLNDFAATLPDAREVLLREMALCLAEQGYE